MAARLLRAGIDSLVVRARVVKLALWIFIVVTGLTILADLVTLVRQMQWADPPLLALNIMHLFSLLFLALLLLSTVPILAWVYRAHANLSEGGVESLNYRPGWAVGSYFVPFVNCMVPFKAMRELYNRSHGEPADFAQSSAGPVSSWWACHIAAVFHYAMMSFVAFVPLVSNVSFTTPPAATTGMSIFSQLLWLGSAWFLLQTVNRITEAQAHGVATANVFD